MHVVHRIEPSHARYFTVLGIVLEELSVAGDPPIEWLLVQVSGPVTTGIGIALRPRQHTRRLLQRAADRENDVDDAETWVASFRGGGCE